MADYEKNRPVEKIKQQAARFSWDACAAEYIDVYKQILL
jgi:glycosyltransferase involved in cell wall biosynthesis